LFESRVVPFILSCSMIGEDGVVLPRRLLAHSADDALRHVALSVKSSHAAGEFGEPCIGVEESLETSGESTESHALLPILLLQEEFLSSPGNSPITFSGRRVHM